MMKARIWLCMLPISVQLKTFYVIFFNWCLMFFKNVFPLIGLSVRNFQTYIEFTDGCMYNQNVPLVWLKSIYIIGNTSIRHIYFCICCSDLLFSLTGMSITISNLWIRKNSTCSAPFGRSQVSGITRCPASISLQACELIKHWEKTIDFIYFSSRTQNQKPHTTRTYMYLCLYLLSSSPESVHTVDRHKT